MAGKIIQLLIITTALLDGILSGATGSDGGVFKVFTNSNGSIYFGTVSPGINGGFAPFDYLALGPSHDVTGLMSLITTPNLDPRIYSGLNAILAGPTVTTVYQPNIKFDCQFSFGTPCPPSQLTVNGIGFSTGLSAPFSTIPPTVSQVLQTAKFQGLLGNVDPASTPVSSSQKTGGNVTFNDVIVTEVPIGSDVFETIFDINTNHDTLYELNIKVGPAGPAGPPGVPEPGTWLLCATGLLGAGSITRSRRRKKGDRQ